MLRLDLCAIRPARYPTNRAEPTRNPATRRLDSLGDNHETPQRDLPHATVPPAQYKTTMKHELNHNRPSKAEGSHGGVSKRQGEGASRTTG